MRLGVLARLARPASIAVVVLLVGSQVAPTARSALAPQGIGSTLGQALGEADEAKRFREEFGLRSDRAYVDSVARTQPRSQFFGVALTPAEEALMTRRSELPSKLDAVRRYRSRHRDIWGGMWLTYPRGGTLQNALTLNVSVTRNTAGHAKAISALLPTGLRLDTHVARFRQQDLDALAAKIVRDTQFFRSLGAEFYSAATFLEDGIVEIAVPTLDSAIEDAIVGRYGREMVRVREGGPVLPDACTRTNCGPPWTAGVKILREGANNTCTANYVVQKYVGVWVYAIWTAGHCGSGTWRQGSATGAVIGTTSANYFANNSDADIQVIPITSSQRDNYYIDDTATCNPCIKRPILDAETRDEDVPGQTACNNGYVSGQRCGTIQSVNFNFVWEEKGVTLPRMRLATYSRQPGDSGGPVRAAHSMATGSHTHFEVVSGVTRAVYTHVFEAEEKSGYTVYKGT